MKFKVTQIKQEWREKYNENMRKSMEIPEKEKRFWDYIDQKRVDIIMWFWNKFKKDE